jgi:archaellum component FlaG (FlaF/FlaG flagellin family)
MKKLYLILLIVVVAILVAVVGVYKYVNQKVADVATSTAEATVSADEFAHAVVQDSAKAKTKYTSTSGGDYIIELKGKVSKKETDAFDQVSLYMTVGDIQIQCTCAPDQKTKAKAVPIGTTVTVKGNYTGYNDDIEKVITINKCIIEK